VCGLGDRDPAARAIATLEADPVPGRENAEALDGGPCDVLSPERHPRPAHADEGEPARRLAEDPRVDREPEAKQRRALGGEECRLEARVIRRGAESEPLEESRLVLAPAMRWRRGRRRKNAIGKKATRPPRTPTPMPMISSRPGRRDACARSRSAPSAGARTAYPRSPPAASIARRQA
jgi:hypothetical protein